MTVTMAADGHLVVPKDVRDALGLKGEETFDIRVENGEMRLIRLHLDVEGAQALYRKHVKNPRTSEDFLASRERD